MHEVSGEDREDDDDSRRDERQPIELKVEYKRLNAFFADYTKNISRGGTFIQTSKPLPVGTEFVFKLHVPSLPEPLRIRGQVKWIVEPPRDDEPPPPRGTDLPAPGMGIRFVYGTVDERQRVEDLVADMLEDSLGLIVSRKIIAKTNAPDES